ncbi:MAG: hypothetical protein AAF229_12275 [Pseudomonadota bacterium]
MKKILFALALGLAGTASASFSTIGEVTDFGDGSFFLDTGADFGTSATNAEIEGALQIPPGALEFLEEFVVDPFDDGDVLGGSAIFQDIEFGSGDTLSFDWVWNTNEGAGFSLNADFAAVTISGPGGAFGFALANAFDDVSGEAGTFSLMNDFLPTGIYTLGILVVNVDLFGLFADADSFLDVSNFTKVPAPGTLLLALLGIFGIGAARRRS